MQIFISETPTATPTPDDVLQTPARVSAMYGRALWVEILLLLLLPFSYFKTCFHLTFIVFFFVNSCRCRFGHIVSSLAVNSDSYRRVLEVRLHVDELRVEQLNVESFGEGCFQVGVQGEHEGGHGDMRGFEGEEVVISQHEPAKVDSRRVDQV